MEVTVTYNMPAVACESCNTPNCDLSPDKSGVCYNKWCTATVVLDQSTRKHRFLIKTTYNFYIIHKTLIVQQLIYISFNK